MLFRLISNGYFGNIDIMYISRSNKQNNFFFLFREMKSNNVSRIQYHSVIRSPKAKIAIIQPNGEKVVNNITYYL